MVIKMARINKSALTKLEIVQESSKQILEKGYTATSITAISRALGMSPRNLTFYYPTKEHLLVQLVELMCDFQWKRMEEEADEGLSSIMALCLELTSMATAAEDDPMIRDFFLASYTSPMCLERIRKNDAERAQKIFADYRPDWTEEQFAEAEILCFGTEYATLMASGDPIPLETRIAGALHNILGIYGIPREIREQKIGKVFAMDYRNLGKRVLREFRDYVEQANEHALLELLGH